MYCPNCGTFNNDNNNACTNCGTMLKSVNTQQQPYAAPQFQQQSPYAQPRQPHYAQPLQQQSPYAQPQQPRYAQPLQQQPRYAQPLQQQSPYTQPQQPNYGAAQPVGPQYAQQPNYMNTAPEAPASGFAAIWYKIMTFVGFFLTAAGFFMIGLGNMIGWQYGASSGSYYGYSYNYRYVDVVAENYGGLRAADFITGVIFMGLGVFAILAWIQFKSYKKSAAMLTCLVYCGFAALQLAYSALILIVFLIDGATFSQATGVYPIVFPIIMIVVVIAVFVMNLLYFKKEKFRYIN